MTNIKREHIEDFTTFAKNAVIEAAVVTGKDYKPYLIRVDTICDLALRALSPSTTRYVELPEGHVVVPLNPTEAMWGSDLVRLLMVWCEGPKITPRSLIEAAKFRGIELPEWLLKEKEMQEFHHTVSKGTRAVLLYRAMIGEVK